VILAHTIKGYGFGAAGEAQNTTHNLKKLDVEALKKFRDRFGVPLTDEQVEQVNYYRPLPDSPEVLYMKKRRESLGGYLPSRLAKSQDRKSTRLNSSHVKISYAVFCLKKKNEINAWK